jgi:type IV pilus assembly protein PilA
MFNRKGFTLIELLIVVVIIGILAAIAIPKFATTKDKAKLASIKTDLRNLMTAQEAYFSDYSTYAATVAAITGTPYNFSFSSGNTQQSVTGVASGWTATVTNASISTGSTNRCTVQVGAGAASTLDGTIHCP